MQRSLRNNIAKKGSDEEFEEQVNTICDEGKSDSFIRYNTLPQAMYRSV